MRVIVVARSSVVIYEHKTCKAQKDDILMQMFSEHILQEWPCLTGQRSGKRQNSMSGVAIAR